MDGGMATDGHRIGLVDSSRRHDEYPGSLCSEIPVTAARGSLKISGFASGFSSSGQIAVPHLYQSLPLDLADLSMVFICSDDDPSERIKRGKLLGFYGKFPCFSGGSGHKPLRRRRVKIPSCL